MKLKRLMLCFCLFVFSAVLSVSNIYAAEFVNTYTEDEAEELIIRCKENIYELRDENDFIFKNLIDNNLIFE